MNIAPSSAVLNINQLQGEFLQHPRCNALLYETFRVMTMINVADLKDPNDPQGRTYREVNNATQHAFAVGDLIELENGVRLFIAKQTRDCDGTPLYSMSHKNDGDASLHGFSEDDMERV